MPSNGAIVGINAAPQEEHHDLTVNLEDPLDVAVPERESSERRILVIYVGGTIGMKRNALGSLEPSKGYLTEKMKTMNELKESALVAKFDIIECEPLLDSSDMSAEDYMKIAKIVVESYDKYNGFLIAIGTDTMHYAAAALSFLLYNLAKPVVVTGAMVPLAMPFNDARRNLIIGMMLASHSSICEVCIFFNDSLFRGNRCDKVLHTFAAFQSPGYPALGVITGKKFCVRQSLLLPQPTGGIRLLSNMQARVVVFHMSTMADVDSLVDVMEASRESTSSAPVPVRNPSNDMEDMKAPRKKLVNAVILVLDGMGSLHGALANLLRRIEAASAKQKVVVCVTTPSIRKTLTLSAQRTLKKIAPSFVYLHDMCHSTAEVKLMYLFGKGLDFKEVARLMPVNIRGEVSPPSHVKSRL